MDTKAIAKTEFNKAALEGAFSGGKRLNFDDLRMLSGMSQFLRDYSAQSGEFRCPIHIRAEAAVMDDKFEETWALHEELKDYINNSEVELANYLVSQAFPDYKGAKRIMDKAIKDAREKKARTEKTAKEEAEYQARKEATRQARAGAPEPEEKPLPPAGKQLKKKDEDDEFSAYSGAGAGKKRK